MNKRSRCNEYGVSKVLVLVLHRIYSRIPLYSTGQPKKTFIASLLYSEAQNTFNHQMWLRLVMVTVSAGHFGKGLKGFFTMLRTPSSASAFRNPYPYSGLRTRNRNLQCPSHWTLLIVTYITIGSVFV